MQVELKPCPFCGGEALDFYRHNTGATAEWCGPVDHWVCCTGDCGASTCMHGTKDEAIAAWNRRAEQAADLAKWRDKYNELGQMTLEQVSDLGAKLGRLDVELDAAKADLQAANRELAKFKALAETLAFMLEAGTRFMPSSATVWHREAAKALREYKEARDER